MAAAGNDVDILGTGFFGQARALPARRSALSQVDGFAKLVGGRQVQQRSLGCVYGAQQARLVAAVPRLSSFH